MLHKEFQTSFESIFEEIWTTLVTNRDTILHNLLIPVMLIAVNLKSNLVNLDVRQMKICHKWVKAILTEKQVFSQVWI